VVDRYGEIAPHTPHALHMPSHIHVRLGNWPEVIEWNRESAEAALRHPVGDAVSFHHIHALDYQLYGHLQRGNDEQARMVLDEALSTGPYQEDFNSAFHLAIMPARFAVERRAWERGGRAGAQGAGLPGMGPVLLARGAELVRPWARGRCILATWRRPRRRKPA
jgi:hypothetical protein